METTKQRGYSCNCKCHPGVRIHPTNRCECGHPVIPENKYRAPCGCTCHKEEKVHATVDCDCCQPVTPRDPPCCPPPPDCPQPGTVDIPQTPPPEVKTESERPENKDRPPPGSSAEIPWFKGEIRSILQNGPTFGPRKDEFLPYLLIRTASGDRGARSIKGVFWESPDIYVTPGQHPTSAPLAPSALGGTARANAPNTLYAHVWNLGKAPAWGVRVEFYWFNPSLGISYESRTLIGTAWIDLGNRFANYPKWTQVDGPSGSYLSKGCHAIVKCPEPWNPDFVNNGHECLVVRASEHCFDAVPKKQFSASADRHVAQRNIAVVRSASPAAIDLALDLGYLPQPAQAQIDVTVDAPASMEWLKLYTGKADPALTSPRGAVVSGLLPAGLAGGRVQRISDLPFEERHILLNSNERISRGCDPLTIGFHASTMDLQSKEAQVLRVRQRVNGEVVGGYSVVLIGA